MEFSYSDEQRMLREMVAKFMHKECPRQYIRDLDQKGQSPPGLLKKMAQLGWTALPFPKEYGGLNGSMLDVAIILEEFGRSGFIAASIYNRAILFGGMSILTYGSDEQQQKYIPMICRGELTFALALTEPDTGSDAASLTTSAVSKGNTFIINGHKTWITGADEADYLVVPCRTNKEAPKSKGITNFLVDRKLPGIKLRTLDKIGNRMVNACEIFFDNLVIPEDNILGELNSGFDAILRTLKYSRVGLSASVTGTAQAAVSDALEYAKQREQFGRPIGKFQVIKHRLADMQMAVDAARLLAYRAAWMISEGLACDREAAMAKLFATETLQKVTSQGMQILGAYGYSTEFDMQRYWRDARLYTVGEGTSEIQRELIARTMGL